MTFTTDKQLIIAGLIYQAVTTGLTFDAVYDGDTQLYTITYTGGY